jgi:protein ImuA
MEEGLRCPALAAVAGDTSDLDFDTTRRLHLAARRSGLPLFLIKPRRAILTPSAATTRWCITSKATETDTGRTGWRVDLLRCRGGKSQSWDVDFNLDEQRITDDIKHHAKYSQPVAYAA